MSQRMLRGVGGGSCKALPYPDGDLIFYAPFVYFYKHLLYIFNNRFLSSSYAQMLSFLLMHTKNLSPLPVSPWSNQQHIILMFINRAIPRRAPITNVLKIILKRWNGHGMTRMLPAAASGGHMS
jgi:hypothetical protein